MAEYPEKLQFLFQPMRYKCARGGRGSAKSWSFARALLQQGISRPLRILCTREVQESIKDSVHKLLSDQVQAMGYGSHYDVLSTEIRGKNGTLFIFSGLSNQTVESIKSYEGIDITWCEEAQAISKRSWNILIPTIRKNGSEIWVSFNPELDTDETYQRFVSNPPDDCVSVLVNYSDNPWFPEVLEKERLRCKLIDPKGYDNIWEGKCKPAVSGAIYYDEMSQADEEGQICNVPYDPFLKVHIVFDLGWNDAMAISLVQVIRNEVRIIEYIEDSHKTLDNYSAMLKDKRLNWGKVFFPHDGAHKDFKTGKSAVQIMSELGWDVQLISMHTIETGIKATRMALRRMYFSKKKTERLIQCLKRYRRQINQATQEAGAPLHDKWSHGADNVRYIAMSIDQMDNDDVEEYEEEKDDTRSQCGGY